MRQFFKTWISPALVGFGLLLGISAACQAQDNSKKDYPLVAKVNPNGEELSAQPRLWMMEVHMKPMRMIQVPLTNPETGRKKIENIWYMVYKAINRPLPFKEDASNTTPSNDDDQEPLEQMFVPVFTLRTDDITNDMPVRKTYPDVILPEAQKAINLREGRNEQNAYKNSVEIMQAIPQATPEDQGDANAIYGVAMWRGVDRNTDYFTIYMSGFSNGYRYVNDPVSFQRLKELADNGELKPSDAVWSGASSIRTASQICNWKESIKAQTDSVPAWQSAASVGGLFDAVKSPPPGAEDQLWYYTKSAESYPRDQHPPVWRRTIVQHFSRFGDEINETEDEFRACMEPHWYYWPDDAKSGTALPAKPENIVPGVNSDNTGNNQAPDTANPPDASANN